MSNEHLIVSRLLCELRGAEKIALGPGLPKRVIPYLDPEHTWVDLEQKDREAEIVDIAVVEALEVAETGRSSVPVELATTSVKAKTWIAAGRLRSPHDSLQLVKTCTLPTQIGETVKLVVTELGVIRVTEIGFELVEISPGAGSDDIRMQVRASLHVADDLKRIQLCA
jgi:acyl CoA:acetate/3-ketoacid CoA transferase beta subunit